MPESADKAKARRKAEEDIKKQRSPLFIHPDSGARKAYFDTYYTIRTAERLKHIIDKYGPLS
jgi:hypothetical protein